MALCATPHVFSVGVQRRNWILAVTGWQGMRRLFYNLPAVVRGCAAGDQGQAGELLGVRGWPAFWSAHNKPLKRGLEKFS